MVNIYPCGQDGASGVLRAAPMIGEGLVRCVGIVPASPACRKERLGLGSARKSAPVLGKEGIAAECLAMAWVDGVDA